MGNTATTFFDNALINLGGWAKEQEAKAAERKANRDLKKFEREMKRELKTSFFEDIDNSEVPESVDKYLYTLPLIPRGHAIKVAAESNKLVKWVLKYISTYTEIIEPLPLNQQQKEFANSIAALFDAKKIYDDADTMDLNLVSTDSNMIVSDPKFIISVQDILKRRSPEFMEKVAKTNKSIAERICGMIDEYQGTDAQPSVVTDPNAPYTFTVTPTPGLGIIPPTMFMVDNTSNAIAPLTISDASEFDNKQGDLTQEEFNDYESCFKQILEPIGKYTYKKGFLQGVGYEDLITIRVNPADNHIFDLHVDNGSVLGFKLYSIMTTNPIIGGSYFVPVIDECESVIKNILATRDGQYILTAEEVQLVDSVTSSANFITSKVLLKELAGKKTPEKLAYKIIMRKLGAIYQNVMDEIKPGFDFYSRIDRYINENDFSVVADKNCPVPEGQPMLYGLSATVRNNDITIMYKGQIIKKKWGGISPNELGDKNGKKTK